MCVRRPLTCRCVQILRRTSYTLSLDSNDTNTYWGNKQEEQGCCYSGCNFPENSSKTDLKYHVLMQKCIILWGHMTLTFDLCEPNWTHSQGKICALIRHCDIDLCLLNSNQVILGSKWMLVPDVMKFPVSVPDLSCSQEHEFPVTLTFDIRPLKSNQFIFESKWRFVPDLKKLPQSVLEVSCWQNQENWEMEKIFCAYC